MQSRQITQKCIVAKVTLKHPDGSEEEVRPSESRLYKPTDPLEDLSVITQTLQEALRREKTLEDKLVKMRTLIGNNIGKTHTDLLRLFEKMNTELIDLYDEENGGANISFDKVAMEKV